MNSDDHTRTALRLWVEEALARLATQEPLRIPEEDGWRDLDGLYRRHHWFTLVWPYDAVGELWSLDTWSEAQGAMRTDGRFHRHMEQLVGTAQGASRVGPTDLGRHILPEPSEVDDWNSAFERRFDDVLRFLAAEDVTYNIVWPLPFLQLDESLMELEPDVEVGDLTDHEYAIIMKNQVTRSPQVWVPAFGIEGRRPMCLRYRYKLPIHFGDLGESEIEMMGGVFRAIDSVATAFEQCFVVTVGAPAPFFGRSVVEADWSPALGSMNYWQDPLPQQVYLRPTEIGAPVRESFTQTWRRLREPDLLRKQKTIALALRRLGYQAHRHDPEDSLVDALVAAEAIYLSDVSQTELGFRLALRAAALWKSDSIDMSRRDVFDLMRTAYAVRSTIVHGAVPREKDIKIGGSTVSLDDFVAAATEVIRQAVREALARASSGGAGWPPDWDSMTLPRRFEQDS